MDDLRLYKRVDQLEKDIAELQELVYNQHQQIDTLSKICSSLINRLKGGICGHSDNIGHDKDV